ncbi:MAG: polyphenol oxidase family protein [bacterium]|nr:polyphenol oxidase family protein [bacterium]
MAWGRGSVEQIAANRARWADQVGLVSAKCVSLEQTHSSRVLSVSDCESGAGFFDPRTRLVSADGLITDDGSVTLITSHADCAPIYLYGDAPRVIGLVHAGWRGTLGGIASTTVALLARQHHVAPRDLRVAVGPLIATANYPVGDDVARAFTDKYGPGTVVRFGDRLHLDIFASIVIDLLRAGVEQARFIPRPPDTFSNSRWSSYRRDGEQAGGMLAYIRLIS